MAKATTKKAASAVTTETRYRVKINPDKGPGGSNNIDLIINGVRNSLQRGVEILLTAAQLEGLENAETQGYSMEIEGRQHVVSSIKRYSYNVYGSVQVPVSGSSPEVATAAVEVADEDGDDEGEGGGTTGSTEAGGTEGNAAS